MRLCAVSKIYLSKPNSPYYFSIMSQTLRSLSITEQEETVLVEMIKFFNDMGLPDDINSTDYDTLTDKICDPAFWEYN